MRRDEAITVIRGMALALGGERTEVQDDPNGYLTLRIHVGDKQVPVKISSADVDHVLSDLPVEARVRTMIATAIAEGKRG